MDLSSIKPSTVTVDIVHPGTGRKTGLAIEMTNFDTPAVKKVERKYTDKMFKARGRKMTSAEFEENRIERLVATVVGWKWNDGAAWGGKKLDFNPGNVEIVLREHWVARQLEEALSDEAGFFEN